jgi:hypothetical protein
MSLIQLQVAKFAKSDEPRFLRAWSFCVVVHPTLNGPAASNSRHPPSVLSRPNDIIGKYSQTRSCGGVSRRLIKGIGKHSGYASYKQQYLHE